MDFDEAFNYLLSLGHETIAIKFGLENTLQLLQALDRPHEAYHSLQIAGTNGKGSTAAFVDSICRSAGIRTGLYTSPHLVSITERFRINGREISRADFARLTDLVISAVHILKGSRAIDPTPTFFEHVTCIALAAFREAHVQLAILETGMGGRLDSVTAAGAKTIGITPITYDHEAYLGNAIEEIAAEKAAVICSGSTVVAAPQKREVETIIRNRAREVGARLLYDYCSAEILKATGDGRFRCNFITPRSIYRDVILGMRGAHQVLNASVAIGLAESLIEEGFKIPKDAVCTGLQEAKHSGRMELCGGSPQVLLDGAHNVAGAEALRDYLIDFGRRPLTLVFGAMEDKNISQMAAILFPLADKVILTSVNNPRAASTSLLRNSVPRELDSRILIAEESREALEIATRETISNGLICVTGSLYLVGELKALLQPIEHQHVL